jgi:hypothetical protein
MTEAETAAQEALRHIVKDLEAIRFRLWGVHSTLPVPARETAMLVGEEDMDVALEVRTVIECVINDWISSAIRDLQAAAEYRPDPEE